ncbi:MAG: Holliday junction ATP-dependent DNA helicase RuvA [Candidatus Giovannonibacteria bacterium GW2011_GWA1_43_15]|uniref:Holliday junction branch migration complex subunit RuvA n=2 Tax=Candidatus Giovannoniibacteriota TaxID=1752738 RepID=A0A0G1IVK5_9BACT|nr:MAG: Holliday junction ATP-dependent DNA helicase RuvA [Candidatus Giovannonibacteria bacterium GW2011_GWB1_43_13]KKS99202.1 MAG: Holliday junction ATP-dependent DNA helicase RuvA [Candidatus Giovannonibacteria bacterium GW2011_GWA1_43_15]KKT21206.1 MAG: Holliday junction ATP-dependent DNA helicase RuvA [Candidatus Giovannonibacteria bacterium GW2011_GWC2_43_8]KKT63003.1 MAG: Holliday junction ATP-dependent DNA helicase RuvA [Candidatus Giovannonibacteria bacterium GW2011_GWA2_44_26]
MVWVSGSHFEVRNIVAIIKSMIGHLEGKVLFKGERYVVLDVGGVGYKIFVSASSKNLSIGESAKLWTHLHVKEDALELYGFLHQAELEFFESLISISGIGPRSALGVLALAPVDSLKRAISSGDTSYLTKISGIGRKTAEKIVLELKDKMGFGKASFGGEEFKEDTDILDALIALDYSQREAREMLQKIPSNIRGREKRLKEALKMREK